MTIFLLLLAIAFDLHAIPPQCDNKKISDLVAACEIEQKALGCDRLLADYPELRDSIATCEQDEIIERASVSLDGPLGCGTAFWDTVVENVTAPVDLAVLAFNGSRELNVKLSEHSKFCDEEGYDCKRVIAEQVPWLRVKSRTEIEKTPTLELLQEKFKFDQAASLNQSLSGNQGTGLKDAAVDRAKAKNSRAHWGLIWDIGLKSAKDLGVKFDCYKPKDAAWLKCYSIAMFVSPAKAVKAIRSSSALEGIILRNKKFREQFEKLNRESNNELAAEKLAGRSLAKPISATRDALKSTRIKIKALEQGGKDVPLMNRTRLALVSAIASSPTGVVNEKLFDSVKWSLRGMEASPVGSHEYVQAKASLEAKVKYLEFIGKQSESSFAENSKSAWIKVKNSNPSLDYDGFQDCLYGQQTYCEIGWQNLSEAVKMAAQQESIEGAIDRVSHGFKGIRYGHQSTDTLKYNCSELDCVTNVENVLALARSKSASDFEHRISEIRFPKAVPKDWYHYNHHATDWVANNIKAGVISDITSEVGGTSAKKISAEIDHGSWLLTQKRAEAAKIADPVQKEKVLKEAEAMAAKFPAKMATMNYISSAEMLNRPDITSKIPAGTLFTVVVDPEKWKVGQKSIKEVTGTNYLISHMGFVVYREGKPYVRHSSTLYDKMVKEDPLHEYLRRLADSQERLGLALFRANEL